MTVLQRLTLALVLTIVPLSSSWADTNDVKGALAQNKHIGCWQWTSWGEGPLPKDGGSADVICFYAGGEGARRAIGCCDHYESRFKATVRNNEIVVDWPYRPEPEIIQVLSIDDKTMEVKGQTYRLLCRVEGRRESCTQAYGFSRF
ncbi:MAG: hypothetical protein ACLPX9_07140 [Rhodomicrobium sp.]